MKLQGPAATRYARNPDASHIFTLVFGEDEGVVGDTAQALITAWQKQAPSQVITLDEDAVKREPPLLFDALEAVSLLGDATILRLRTRGEKLFSLLKEALAMPPERIAAKVIVQNGALNTRSKMRTAFEQAAHAAALHVFADTSEDIASRLTAQLAAEKIEISEPALAHFVGGLPGHRALANAEIEKLLLFAHQRETPIELSDIKALCETNADENARTAIQLALAGQSARAQAEFDRVIDAGLNPISLIRLFEMEASRMLSALALQSGGTSQNVGMKLKPPVWKSDWPAFQDRLQKWPAPRLIRLMERLHDLELSAKAPGGAHLSGPAIRDLFISCYTAAAALSRKRT